MSTPQTQTQNQPDELMGHFYLLTCQIGQSEMNSGEVAFFESTCNFVGADIAGNTTSLLTFDYSSVTRVRTYPRANRIRLELPRVLIEEWAAVSGFGFSIEADLEVVHFSLSFAPQDMEVFSTTVAPLLAAARGRSNSVLSYASNGDGSSFAPDLHSAHMIEQQPPLHSQDESQQSGHQVAEVEEVAAAPEVIASAYLEEEEAGTSAPVVSAESEEVEPIEEVPATPVPPPRSNAKKVAPKKAAASAVELLHQHAVSPKTGPLLVGGTNKKGGSKRQRDPVPESESASPEEEEEEPCAPTRGGRKVAAAPPARTSTSNRKQPLQTRARSVSSAPRGRSATIIDQSESDDDDDMPVTSFKSNSNAPSSAKKGAPPLVDDEEDVFDFDVSAFASKDFGAVVDAAESMVAARGKNNKRGGNGGKPVAASKRSSTASTTPNKPTPNRSKKSATPAKQPTSTSAEDRSSSTKKSTAPPSTSSTVAPPAHHGHNSSSSVSRRNVSILDDEEDFTPRRSHTAPPPTTMPRGSTARTSSPNNNNNRTSSASDATSKKLIYSSTTNNKHGDESQSLGEKELSAMLASGLPDDDQLDTFLGSALALVQKRRMSRRRAESVGPNISKVVESSLRAHTTTTASHRAAFISVHSQRVEKLEEVMMGLKAAQDALKVSMEASLADISNTSAAVLDALVKTKAKLARDEEKWAAAEQEDLVSAISAANEMMAAQA